MKKSVKKFIPLSLAFSMTIGVTALPMVTSAATTKDKEIQPKITWDQEKGIPDFVSGKLSKKKVKNKGDALAFLKEDNNLFKVDAGEFQVKDITTDELGMTHYRTEMTIDGISVYGSDLYVHVNKNGEVYTVNGEIEPKIENKKWSKQVKLSANEAVAKAESYLELPSSMSYTSEPTSDLYLYQDKKQWLPVYLVELQFLEPYPGREFVFVSAKDGKVVEAYNAISEAAATGTGKKSDGTTVSLNTYSSGGQFYLYDTTKPMNGVIETYTANNRTQLPGNYVTDNDNVFNASAQAAAVDAHYNAGITYDYYYNTFGRNSYDDNGSSLVSTVHYGQDYNNAFWNGSQMVYGDGDGTTFSPLSGALDVIAHELTHAVTESTANLVYQNQPGALNESMSDVFGTIVEAYDGDMDWLMGEDVYTPGTRGDGLRSMKDPTLYNQPAHMNNYVNTTADNGGVHTNSGIPNKAFYNIATKIGLDKSGKIYYRALTTYLTSQSDFADARSALLQAANDLYGESSSEYTAVENGFAAVGINGSGGVGGDETPGSDNYEPNDNINNAFGPLTSGKTYQSFISTTTDEDFFKFNANSGNNVRINLSNLPDDYDVYLYNSGGSLVGSSENARTRSETINHSISQSGTYYVLVVGWNGANSVSNPYHLTVSVN
ncbi:M4 family metallopeptidase [Aquibacillus kalidii]|uniref:M4 family metallopeptidase n=1 Tax=Aquibacillus kalidii TaxID=2762597 RepID=UPI00164755FF|nr:M4 family metallopeptidase [Aquibacillus kalidii]